MCALFLISSSITASAATYQGPVLQTTITISQTTTEHGIKSTVNVNKFVSAVSADISTDRTAYPAMYVSLNGNTYYGGLIRNLTTASATTSVTGYNPTYGFAKYTYEY